MGLDVSGIGEAVSGADDILHMFFPDKTKEEIAKMSQAFAIIQGQIDTNKAEAAQPGLHFRDGAGWVCVFAFALSALKAPIEWACMLAGHPVTLPPIDTSETSSMLVALLGLGTMHAAQVTIAKVGGK